jgi:uncharacterized protein
MTRLGRVAGIRRAHKQVSLDPENQMATTRSEKAAEQRPMGQKKSAQRSLRREIPAIRTVSKATSTERSASAGNADTSESASPFAHLPYELAEAPAFVREVLLPGGPQTVPRIDAESAAYLLEVKPSRIHRYGVFACESIPANVRVIEYTGERISYREASRRSVRPHLYLFWLTPGLLIDGAIGGSGAEFVNHCCEPNLMADVRDGKVHFVSLRRIREGEELSIDYKIRGNPERIACLCRSLSCRGFLNFD